MADSAGNSERELISRCVAGEPSAWGELVARYKNLVAGLSRRLLAQRGLPHGEQEVDEATTDFFSNLYIGRETGLRGFCGRGSLRAYLAVLAANRIRRQAKVHIRYYEELRGCAEILGQESRGEPQGGGDEEIRAALSRCNAAEKLLFEILYVDGLTPEEAARIFNTTREAIYLRRHRFLAKLESVLRKRAGREASREARANPQVS